MKIRLVGECLRCIVGFKVYGCLFDGLRFFCFYSVLNYLLNFWFICFGWFLVKKCFFLFKYKQVVFLKFFLVYFIVFFWLINFFFVQKYKIGIFVVFILFEIVFSIVVKLFFFLFLVKDNIVGFGLLVIVQCFFFLF